MDKKKFDYWLYSLPGIGKKTFIKIYEEGFSSFYLYKCDKNKLPSILSEKQRFTILKGREKKVEELDKAFLTLKEKKIFMAVFYEENYPKKLLEIPDAPAVLFYKGTLPLENQKNIAIIGARNCSEYGKYVAESFAAYFAQNNVGVISGMANGIDGVAQKAALKEGGYSLGVLGSGVNVCYPSENYDLYRTLSEKGCIVSEYLPFEKASANMFPKRNRIISGLSDAILVVEAREKSGTLITVEMALEQGKDVYVIPGRVTDILSRGCNKLLAEGASVALSPEEMLNEIYGMKAFCKKENEPEKISETGKKILSFLDVTPVHINVLQEKTGINPEGLYVELMHMIMEEKVIQVSNNWYQKVKVHL